MRSQVRQRDFADGVVMSELQTHYCITWLLGSVSAIPVNKMLLQELNQSIKMLTSDFLNIFVS